MKLNPIDVQKSLKDISYPAGKDEVVSTAERNGGGDEVVSALRGMDAERFEGPDEVMKALDRSGG